MVITRGFVILHVPKTGGSFLKAVCEKYLPEDWVVEHDLRTHARHDQIPRPYADLPVFAVVRNPWDWYVSYWHYMNPVGLEKPPKRQQSKFWDLVFGSSRGDFEAAVTMLCTGDFDHPRGARVRELGMDLYTWRFFGILGDGLAATTIGRTEDLGGSFKDFLDRHDIAVPGRFRDALETHARANTTARGSYRDYYGDELRALVQQRAAPLIERYGYRF